MYSNMDSDGNTISVIEELLGERVRRRTFFHKYFCCLFFPKQNGTLDIYGFHSGSGSGSGSG